MEKTKRKKGGFAKPKIEKGVAKPTRRSAPNLVYPWREMEVGDSFVVPDSKASSIRCCAALIKRRTGMRFTTRKTGDGFVRVWREE